MGSGNRVGTIHRNTPEISRVQAFLRPGVIISIIHIIIPSVRF